MSRVTDLLGELCPTGVKLKALGEVGDLIRGRRFTKDDVVPVGLASIHYGEIYTRYGTSTTTTFSRVQADLAPQLRFARPGDVVIAAVGETVEDVGKAVAWLGDGDVAVHDDCFIFRHSLDPKFVSYCFQTSMLNAQKTKYVARAKVKRLSGESLSKLRIPVPPPEIQREIVCILDTFAELEADLAAELEAELEARRKQYAFYRAELLTFGDHVPRRLLGDIATIGTGSHDTKDAISDGDYVFYARGRDPLRLNTFDFDERAIITAGDGVGVGKVFHFADGKYALHQRAYRIVPNEGINARYIYHYVATDFARYLERTSVHASVTSLRRPMFVKYPVAVPQLEEQARIADTLDTFDVLVTDLSIGLRAELKERRRQYEYYRDRLLACEHARG